MLKTNLKDTISESIKNLIIDTRPFWDNIHDTADKSREERAAAWDEINKVHAHNENVDKLGLRISQDFYEFPKRRIEHIKELAEETLPIFDKATEALRGFCHHEDCEYSDGCPSEHQGEADEYGEHEPNCHELLNLMSPFYWMVAGELEDIARDVRHGIIENLESPFALIFALSQSIYRYETIYKLAGMQTYHGQHDDSYDERGLTEFYILREDAMWRIKTIFGTLSALLDDTAQELRDYAQAWKLKEPKKEE